MTEKVTAYYNAETGKAYEWNRLKTLVTFWAKPWGYLSMSQVYSYNTETKKKTRKYDIKGATVYTISYPVFDAENKFTSVRRWKIVHIDECRPLWETN